MTPNLLTYCPLYDNAAAPNPFWGKCTLAICKPKIRLVAEPGDWIAATGSAKYVFQNQLIYAMKVTQKMTFEEYDNYCKKFLPEKIPTRFGRNLKKEAGDCLYDYLSGKVVMRDGGPHNIDNMKRDLSGKFVLLSDYFYYFGSKPVPLPGHLLKVVKQGQGHKSVSNAPYVEQFVNWVNSFKKQKNKVNATPFGLLQQNREGLSCGDCQQ